MQKYLESGHVFLVVGILVLAAYNWRSFDHERMTTQRNNLAVALQSVGTQINGEAGLKIQDILTRAGRPDLAKAMAVKPKPLAKSKGQK